MSDDDFRRKADESLSNGGRARKTARGRIRETAAIFPGNYDDPETFQRLAKRLDELDSEGRLGGNRLFYWRLRRKCICT